MKKMTSQRNLNKQLEGSFNNQKTLTDLRFGLKLLNVDEKPPTIICDQPTMSEKSEIVM